MRIQPPALLLFATLAFFSGALSAAQPAVSPDHVVFYTEPNFQGESLTVEAGASVEDLGRLTRPSQRPWIRAISSVKVVGAAQAVVTSERGLQGDRLEINRSIADLYGERRRFGETWDRAIAAVSVTAPRRPGLRPAPVVTPVQPFPERTTPVYVVPSPTPPPVHVRPIDLRGVDAMIRRAYREVLNREVDPEGLRHYRSRVVDGGWTEDQVIRQLQRSDEARAVDATAAITAAYREILGRDPDPQGLNHYRGRWRDGWTQGRIRDDLRRSEEGRGLHIRNVITSAYRDLLGREPDPDGLANYERLMRDKGYTERDIRRALMNSEEYRDRRR